jgi:hypothetical protein
MDIILQNESAEVRKAISEIARLRNTTSGEVLKKAQAVQRIWRFRTLEDGILFLLDVTRLDHVISARGH